MTGEQDGCRIDKWLWHARFVRTRTLAQALCASGRVRVNGEPCTKAHQRVRPGDVLTFPLPSRIRIVRIQATAVRRGSAAMAQQLYEDLEPAQPRAATHAGTGFAPATTTAPRAVGSGRPTKRQRRDTDRLRDR